MNLFLYTIPKLAWTLSDRSPARFLSLLLTFWYFLITRKYVTGPKDILVSSRYNGIPIPMTLTYPMDIAVLREIYVDREYEWCPISDPKVIVDLGAHFGDTALYYHARFPMARIIAVEPSPDSFVRLERNTEHIQGVTCVQKAVSSVCGNIDLNITSSSLGSSLVARKETVHTVSVPSLTLHALCSDYNIVSIDILKFDIEGAEFALFKTMSRERQPKILIGEVHLDLEPNWTLDDVRKCLPEYSIVFDKIIDQKRYLMKAVNTSVAFYN